MTIERLSIPGGMVIKTQEATQIDKLIKRFPRNLTTMLTGEYDITPKDFTYALFRHTLLVHPDGTGTYRAIPLKEDVAMSDYLPGLVFEKTKMGGKIIKIPRDMPSIAVAGNKGNDPKLRLFEVIFWSPGKNST